MEKICDLGTHGLEFIQSDEFFPFGTDGVELANFVTGGSRDRAVDLCCGTGIVPVLLAGKKGIPTVGVELQPRVAELARRNAEHNRLPVEIYEMRVQDAPARLGKCAFDIVTCNPPYRKAGSGEQSANEYVRTARHETQLTAEEAIEAASALLRTGGKFYLVHLCERLDEIMSLCRAHTLMPKTLQLLRPAEGKPPSLFLLRCVKGGRSGLTVLPERTVYGTTADDYPE